MIKGYGKVTFKISPPLPIMVSIFPDSFNGNLKYFLISSLLLKKQFLKDTMPLIVHLGRKKGKETVMMSRRKASQKGDEAFSQTSMFLSQSL